ncbi:hypothetical protein D3C73_1302480 [compost metagenome]
MSVISSKESICTICARFVDSTVIMSGTASPVLEVIKYFEYKSVDFMFWNSTSMFGYLALKASMFRSNPSLAVSQVHTTSLTFSPLSPCLTAVLSLLLLEQAVANREIIRQETRT